MVFGCQTILVYLQKLKFNLFIKIIHIKIIYLKIIFYLQKNNMKFFFKHPVQVNMTYFEHFKLSLHLSNILFKGSIKAFIHAIYPDIFITSTSDTTKLLIRKLKN